MAIYTYKPGSLIDEMTVLTNDSGGARAYLHARADATPEQLRQVQAGIRNLGWKALPTIHEGKPVLEVRGFKKPQIAEQQLAANGWVIGPPSIEMQEGDKHTGKERLQNATLRMAGISYIAGDSSYIWYSAGPLVKDWKNLSRTARMFDGLDVVAGVGYILGSVALARYGSRDQSQNTIQAATRKIQHYVRKEGLAPSEDDSLTHIVKEPRRSPWGKLDHLMAKYPSETLNSVYVFVGSALSAVAFYRGTRPIDQTMGAQAIKSAIEKRSAFRQDVGLGMVTMTSALAGLTIKEKKPVEGEPKRHGLGRVWEWIQEKPLRATGYGYMIATLFHAWGTVKHYRNKTIPNKYLAGRAVFVTANLISELLLALSSKGHGVGVKPDESIDQSVIAATADFILRQPVEKREQLVSHLAGYMAAPEVLGGQAEDIAAELRKQLAGLQANPWVRKVMPPAPAPAHEANNTVLPTNDMERPSTHVVGGEAVPMAHAPAQIRAT